jgi:Spy/CpxP family protein refolding chaperone
MCRIITVMFTVGLILAGSTTRFAAGSEFKGYSDKVQNRIETLAMWRLIETLDLDQPTADKLLGIRHKFLIQRKSLQKGLSEDFQALRKQLSEPSKPADDQELTRLLQDIHEKRKGLQALREQQYDAVSKVLTVRQRAQLVLFFKDFHRELRSFLRIPPPPGSGPEKGMERPRAGMGPLNKKMAPPPGTAGLGEKFGQPPGLAPRPPE